MGLPTLRLSGLAACLACGSLAVPLRQGLGKCDVEASEPQGVHYLVDNSALNAKTRGLSFRFSKSSQDRDAQSVALWGSEVVGLDQGDGWLKVGGCFLPMELKDVPVLRSLAPEGAAQLSQHGAARTYSEAQLKQALTEAAEVTEAVTAKLKRSEAEISQLKAALERERAESKSQLAAAEAKSRDLAAKNKDLEAKNKDLEAKSKDLKQKPASLSPADSIIPLGESEEIQELTATLEEMRRDYDSLNETKTRLEVDLKKTTSNRDGVLRQLTSIELEKKRLEENLHTLMDTNGGGVAEKVLEMQGKLAREKKHYEATIQEMVTTAQQSSVEKHRRIRNLQRKVETLEEKLAAAMNGTTPAQEDNSDSKPAAPAVQAPADPLLDQLLATTIVSQGGGAAGTTDAGSDLQSQLLASEKRRRELEKEIEKVKGTSDGYLMMVSHEVKDIQKKMIKNNHTFQLRFEACERRNTELEDDCEAAKQDLANQIAQLKGGDAAGEASNTSADLHLVSSRTIVSSSVSLEKLEAENKNLSQQVAQLSSEKAAVQRVADDFKAKFTRKDDDQLKTAALVDQLQEKFSDSQAETEKRLQACEQRLAAKEPRSSGAVAPSAGLGAAAALLLAATAAA